MQIFLVRHGQTNDNIKNLMQGWKDTPLNDTGKAQAYQLIPFFESQHIDVIYSSDLSRAYETANIIASALKKFVFLDKNLREMYLGFWEGRSWQEIEAEFAYFLGKPENEKNALNIHSGESYIEFQLRSVKIFKKIISNYLDQTILIVTHGGVIREIIADIMKINQNQKDAIPIRNCSVSKIQYHKEKDQFSIIDLCVW
jgi:broad specificity phosphatase PhoE